MKKAEMISKIQSIITEYGNFTTAEIAAESSPSVGALKGINQLAESFYLDKAEIITYDRNDEEIGSENMNYVDMTQETLKEILSLAKKYKKSQKDDLSHYLLGQ